MFVSWIEHTTDQICILNFWGPYVTVQGNNNMWTNKGSGGSPYISTHQQNCHQQSQFWCRQTKYSHTLAEKLGAAKILVFRHEPLDVCQQ